MNGSSNSDVAAANPTGAMLWVITFGTIVVWLVHVGAEISLAGYSRTHHWATWVMDALTIVLAAVAVLMTLAAWRIVTGQDQDESHDSRRGRIAFMGWMGVYVGLFDVVLIAVEGIYLVTIRA